MKKVLEKRLQKDIIVFFRSNSSKMNKCKSIEFVIDDENNKITRITKDINNKIYRYERIIDNDGDVIQINSRFYILYKKYDMINNEKVLVSQLCKYINGNEKLHVYKYDENGNASEDYIDDRLVTKYKFEGDKIKEITKISEKNEITKYEWDYNDGDFTTVTKNGELSCKFNKTEKIHYNDNNQIEVHIIKEFDNKDRLIEYSTSRGVTILFIYKDDRIVNVKIKYYAEYNIEYSGNNVSIIKNI